MLGRLLRPPGRECLILIHTIMVTRDYLEKEGFKKSVRCPLTLDEYEKEIGYRRYVSVRFHPVESKFATGLFAYSQSHNNASTRKVVLDGTVVTKEDLRMALEICRLP